MAYAILHSTTIILPAWFGLLEDLGLKPCMMPRDVSTRWNSTFDMLEFALEYRAAIDGISGEKVYGLRMYELSEEEWLLASHLYNSLKVHLLYICTISVDR